MSNDYYWQITLDAIAEAGAPAGTNSNAVGITSGNPAVKDREGITESRFDLFDDDGIKYYSGRIWHRNGEELFTPLDQFGAPNAGCTTTHIDGKTL